MSPDLLSVFIVQAGQAPAASASDILLMVVHAGLMVKMVMLLLGAFSVISWAIIIFKSIQLGRARRESYYFLDIFWKSRNLSDVYSAASDFQRSPVAKIFRVGSYELGQLRKSRADGQTGLGMDAQTWGRQSMENVQRALRRSAGAEATRLSRSLSFLATTGNTTPFIGLFGTVWGIMGSFHNIGLTGAASLAAVAPGISEALIATAGGLAAAIPAVVAYNQFTSRVRVLEAEMTNFMADFLNILERDLLRKAAM